MLRMFYLPATCLDTKKPPPSVREKGALKGFIEQENDGKGGL